MESGIYKKIAIKVINKDKVTKDFRDKFLPREIDCWCQLRHPNLDRILGHYETMKYVFLSMEYGEKGDLLAFVQKNGPQPETQARIWLRMIIQAVGYMHSCRIAHWDLKLENCILFDGGIVKVADFGFARKVSSSSPSQTYCGSKSYSPPEILMGHPYSPYKADVWSIGVIGFIVVTDTMPFRENMHNFKMHQKNRNYTYPAKVSLSRASPHWMRFFDFDQEMRPAVLDCLRLLCGGRNDGWNYLKSVECFDPESGVWTELNDLPSPRDGYSLVSYNNSLILMGGEDDGSENLNSVLELNNLRGTWKELPPMKSPRCDFSSPLLNNEIFVIGGKD